MFVRCIKMHVYNAYSINSVMSQQFVLNWFNAKTVKRNVISIRTISKLPTVALVGKPNRFESKNIPSYDYEFRVK